MPIEVKRIGFFHFVRDFNTPMEELKAALQLYANSALEGSLVVLPEAFNLGRSYRKLWNTDPPLKYIESVKPDLTALAVEKGMAFVAGLLEDSDGVWPYNSAYLIFPEVDKPPVRLSRKRDPDGINVYQRPSDNSDQQPYEYGGTCIAALICNDYQRFRGELYEPMAAMNSPRKILCIPACVQSSFDGPGDIGSLRTVTVVLANSDEYGCRSFVANTNGAKKEKPGDCQHKPINEVVLFPWEELD